MSCALAAPPHYVLPKLATFHTTVRSPRNAMKSTWRKNGCHHRWDTQGVAWRSETNEGSAVYMFVFAKQTPCEQWCLRRVSCAMPMTDMDPSSSTAHMLADEAPWFSPSLQVDLKRHSALMASYRSMLPLMACLHFHTDACVVSRINIHHSLTQKSGREAEAKDEVKRSLSNFG